MPLDTSIAQWRKQGSNAVSRCVQQLSQRYFRTRLRHSKRGYALKSMVEGDRLIVPELSRLGRSMLEIMEMLSIAKDKGVFIYAIKGGLEGT